MAEYLDITDAATTITIETTNWKMVFDEGKGGVVDEWYQDGGTDNYAEANKGLFSFGINDTSARYDYGDSASNMYIIENTPTRVGIHVVGLLHNTSGRSYEKYIYVNSSGHIFVDFYFKNTSGTTLACNNLYGYIGVHTSEAYYSGIPMSDGDTTNYPSYGSEYWLGLHSSGKDSVWCYVLNIDNPAAYYNKKFDDLVYYTYYYNDIDTSYTIPINASYRQSICVYIVGIVLQHQV